MFTSIRRTKAEQLHGVGEYVSARKVANNTVERILADGTRIIRLHLTDIVTIYSNGTIEVNSDGYQTSTTKDRINTYIGPQWSLFQERGKWLLYRRADGTKHTYMDGTKLLPDGTLVQPLD
jgi:hypothetical protein